MILKIEQAEVEDVRRDIWCRDGIILEGPTPEPPDQIIDARGKLAVPSFKNGHTHAAMSLLRGFGDDMTLHTWLEQCIFPAEAKFDDEMIYWGTRLACLEMVKGGTTFCNDMYFNLPQSWKAYEESGIKACNGIGITDFFDGDNRRRTQDKIRRTYDLFGSETGRIRLGLGLHAIYTNSDEMIDWTARFGRDHGLLIHMHLSETKKEVDDCLAKHQVRPTEYLARRGILSDNIIFAHAVWLTDKELDLLAEAGSTVIHCPASNMKLVSGEVFPFRRFRDRGIPMMLGTDSHASNNNIDMLEEMKVAALLQKHHFQDPTEAKAEDILTMAQGGLASFFPGLGSSLDPGEPADILLLNPDLPEMVPNYHLASTLVYSALQEAVDTVVCDGRVLMENRYIPEEQEILARVRALVKKLGPGGA